MCCNRAALRKPFIESFFCSQCISKSSGLARVRIARQVPPSWFAPLHHAPFVAMVSKEVYCKVFLLKTSFSQVLLLLLIFPESTHLGRSGANPTAPRALSMNLRYSSLLSSSGILIRCATGISWTELNQWHYHLHPLPSGLMSLPMPKMCLIT